MKRHSYTDTPTHPFEVKKHDSISSILEKMKGISFQGRTLARAYDIWCQALRDECTIFLGLAGAMIPAGMRTIIVYLIENRFIDCIVTTGANMFHDCHETLGFSHFQGSPDVNDRELRKLKIDRIYDTFSRDEEFERTDKYIAKFAAKLDPRPYTTREFLYLLGKRLSREPERGVLNSAAKEGVPIYCPAIADSSICIALAAHLKSEQRKFTFDLVTELTELVHIAMQSRRTAVIFIGGGTPKNYIQQLYVTAGLTDPESKLEGHYYAIQFSTDSPQWGGLSGCTFRESQSWGKIAGAAQAVNCFCDATIALPIIVSGLADRADELRRKKVPQFDLSSEFKMRL